MITGLIAVHLTASILLALFGAHRLSLARHYVRRVASRRPQIDRSTPRYPDVTVQIPLYNERYVAERCIRAAAALDYPTSRVEIQILDDSTDDTSSLVARLATELRTAGSRIVHIRRPSREGFKAGALGEGLRRASGELIAIFDADFVPEPDFLRRVVGEFADPTVGMVQARWGHLNRHASVLTRAQALQLDAHFTIEHGVRQEAARFFNFNGTAGVWRRAAVESAGGWRSDTLTEDLDLSYRAQLAGWRFVYRDDIEVPAELPVEVAAYRLQQQRWAQGGIQTARLLLPRILRAKVKPVVKLEAAFHLLAHLCYPLLVVVALAGFPAGWMAGASSRAFVFAADAALLTFAIVSLGIFYGVAARARTSGWWQVLMVPVILVLGAGISLGQTAAVARGLLSHRTPFRRTPKYRLAGGADVSWRRAVYRVSASGAAVLECVAGIVLLAVGTAAVLHQALLPTGIPVIFGLGYLGVGGGALLQSR